MCTNPRTMTIKRDGQYEEVKVKCGKCDTCKRQKAQEWAIKLIKESQYHMKCCFITLTFDNKILLDKNSKAVKMGASPAFVFNIDYSMKYFQKFIKRLRKKLGKNISYFHVAEYGEKTHRPHHHCIIFGHNFEDDRSEMEISKTGHVQYYSKTLEDLWSCGRTSIQDCNSNNIIYISQYSLKKMKKTLEQKEYNRYRITFSNRCKMNIKFARRHPEEIARGYLQDDEGKKFKVPKSYLDNFKKEEMRSKYWKALVKYEEKIMEHIGNETEKERIKKEKVKEKIRQLQNSNCNKYREF